MAEGLFNASPPRGWAARSAGTEPKEHVRPEAVTVMAELGIDISQHKPKGMEDALGSDVALVVGLCAEEACPVVPGVRSVHWPFPDPRHGDLGHFRQIRDALKNRIEGLKARLPRAPAAEVETTEH